MTQSGDSALTRRLRDLQIVLRRGMLALILLVPERWRASLARSRLLTRFYLFFDRAKYEPLASAPGAGLAPAEPATGSPKTIPASAYDYREPALSDEIMEDLERLSGPLISVIMPVYNSRAEWLRRAVESVQTQWYPHWELCIVDDHSDLPETRQVLGAIADPRIRIQRLETNRHIVGASNAALAMARGDYVALMDHDDELTPDALYRVARAIINRDADFIYSDEDKLDERGRFCDAHFKPDFSPDMFLAQNYLSHLGVIRRSLIDAVEGFTPGTEGAQDYDLYLKVLERAERVVHLPRVLYHWRKVAGSTAAEFGEKSYAQDAGAVALRAAVERRGLDAEVLPGRFPGTYRVKYAIRGRPLVSIVIPFKDKPELLRQCLGSILERSTWTNFEIIGVSNNSQEPETFDEMQRWLERDERICFEEHDLPFNFSEINNFAVREHARGEQIVLLNNDIEIISPDWLESLLEFSQRSDVGVVGGKLYYPDGRLQHAGIILGIGGVAGHSHKYFDREHHGYFSRPHIVQNVSAVTAACWMVKRELYQELGGLDEENLRIAFNDVDFCLRVRESGLLNVFTPYCEAWHHESISRGHEDTPEKRQRFQQEVLYMLDRHGEILAAGDPYYSPRLTLEHENFALSASILDHEPA